MVVAILLFVGVMGAILFGIDKLKRVPTWVVVAGFLGPDADLRGLRPGVPGARTRSRLSLYDAKGKNFVGLDNYVTAFTQDQFQTVLRNTLLWVVLVPIARDGRSG